MNVRLDGTVESVPLAKPVLRELCEKTLPSFNVLLRTSARYTTERQPASQTLAEPVAHNPSPFRQCHPAGRPRGRIVRSSFSRWHNRSIHERSVDGIVESVPLATPVLREPCEKTLPSFNVPLRTSARYTTERQSASQTLAEPVAHNPSPFRQCHPADKFVCIRSF
jgi:hypothetical protein